jgi:hypothetical protein
MTNIATKLRFGAAACAIASAATLTPVPAAQAAPVVPAPTALGATLGSTVCALGVFDPGNCAAGAATIGNVFYLGDVDTTPPPRFTFLTFNPTPFFSLIPVFGPVVTAWWNSINIEVCVGGLSARIGGYGHVGEVNASIGSAGC